MKTPELFEEKESKEQKRDKLLALLREEKTRSPRMPREFEVPIQTVRRQDILEMGVNIYGFLEKSIRNGDFYTPQIPVSKNRRISAHQFLFDALPHRPKSFRGGYPESQRKKVQILRLMEEIERPSVRQVLFNREDLITETQQEVFQLADSEDLKVAIRIWRPDKENIWINSRYWPGHLEFNDPRCIYHVDVFLVDEHNQPIENIGKDLPEEGAIVLGSDWAADPFHKVAVFLDRIQEDELDKWAIANLRHEVGHVQQYCDPEFRSRFKKQTGREIEDFIASHPILEEDAWERAIAALKDIEQRTARVILPEGWESEIERRIKGYSGQHRT